MSKNLNISLKKEMMQYAKRINQIVKLSQYNVNPNSIKKEIATDQNILYNLGDSELYNGSDFEILMGGHIVYRGEKIDSTKDGYTICLFAGKGTNLGKLSEYKLSNLISQFPGSTTREKAKSYFESNRNMSGMGGVNDFIGSIFGGQSFSGYTNENLTSEHVLNALYLLPSSMEVIAIDNFDLTSESVTWNEVVELVTDLVSIGAFLGAAFFSGGATVAASIALALKNVANSAVVIGAINSITDGKYLEAIFSLLLLAIPGAKSSKPFAMFYSKWIADSSSRIILYVPKHFLMLLTSLLDTIALICEKGFLEDFFSWIEATTKKTLGINIKGELSEAELAKLMSDESGYGKVAHIVYTNGGAQRIATNFSNGVQAILSNIMKAKEQLPKV